MIFVTDKVFESQSQADFIFDWFSTSVAVPGTEKDRYPSFLLTHGYSKKLLQEVYNSKKIFIKLRKRYGEKKF